NQNRYSAAWFAAMYDILLDAADDAGDLYLPESIHYCGFIRPMGQRSIVIQVGEEVLKTPTFNMYEVMSMLSEERIPIEGSDFPYGFLDVTDFNRKKFNQFRAIATRNPGRSVEVMLYHFNENNRLVSNRKDENTNPSIPWGDYYKSSPNKYTVDLVIDNIPFNVGKLKKYLIDKDHSNAYAYYKVHDTLNYNTLNQHDDLEMVEEKTITIVNGRYEEQVTMHENSVALYVIENESNVEMVVMPGTLTYDNTDGAQSFSIFNNGNSNLNWTAVEATASGWVTSIFPGSGTVAPQTSESVTVNVDTMGVPDGDFNSKINITTNSGNAPVFLELHKFTPKKNFRVNVGGGVYYDTQGQEWLADQDYARGNYGYTGGTVGSTTDQITNTSDPSLYQTERFDIPGYRFDVPNGHYDLVLHFAEIYFETAGSRVMSVSVEGVSQVPDLDIYDRVGHDTAYEIELTNITVVDGSLDIEFAASAAKTKISAIEVRENEENIDPPPVPESTCRVNAGGNALVGSDGKNWSPDQAFVTGSYGYSGGMAISSTASISNTNDPELYQTARSTMSSYQFSVPNDQYQVIVHLAELQKSATSERLMQISIEGITKIINLDMYALVGKDAAMNLDYRDISVTDGQLEVGFSAFTNVPVVSAIEVVPMSDVTDPPPLDPPAPQSAYWINAGGDPYTDNDGNNWLADHAYVDGGYGFVGGQTAIVLDPIAQTDDAELYQSTRSQMSAYRFDVPNDTYQVILCFAETEVNQAGARLFNIALEGQSVAVDYDIFALVGPFSAHQLEYRDVVVIDGRLDVEFENVVAGGLISGIKITDMDDVTNPPPTPVDPESIYRINAGGNSVTDAGGIEWLADHAYIDGGYGYVGGATSTTNDPISGVTTQELSQTERYNMSAYRFDVPDGSYKVVFHFTEIFFTKSNSRVMEIKIEGETKLSGFDLFAEAGHDVAITKEFQEIAVNDGRLDIDFIGLSASPQVSAIEIINMDEIVDPPPPVEPEDVYRVNLGGQSFLDNDGHQWLQDISYVAGSYGHVDGAVSLTTESITNTSLQVLYQAERYDLSEYRFDVPTGTYQVIFHFAEQQFEAAGQRVFDVQLEDQLVLENYDVFAQAGKLTAKTVEFRDVAVSDGRLEIVFSAHQATACVAGIEIVNMNEVSDPDPDLPRVYRINAGGNAYSDMDSQSWLADKVYAAGSCGYIGGEASSTADMIQGTDDQPLYQTERYNQSAYRFDVPNGAYRVVLHFAEIYFETSGKRKMDISLEGMTKLSGFDIFASAGHDSATQIIFVDIPVTDGRMDVNFIAGIRATKISA
ncbi:hypothetical protein KAH55_13265, partial [bacterium]|nr:hypothetical protein [bacterium]